MALIIALICLSTATLQAQTPPVPPGFELVDLISNNNFENSTAPLGFDPISSTDGSVARTTTSPLAGTASLAVTVNSFGRVTNVHTYDYGAGPFAHSVTLVAKLRVDGASVAGRQLTACAVAYFIDSSDASQLCQDFPVAPTNVVDVFLSLPTNDRQLNYVFPQFALNDSGSIQATVDEVHYYVVQPQSGGSCTEDTWSCTDWSACANGTQTRTCTMTFDCPTVVTPSPATTQSCGSGGSSPANPTTPQHLYAAGISPTRVFLKWSPSASPAVPGQVAGSITGYRVSRDGTQIATVTDGLRYEDSGLAANSTHAYTVVAVDNAGKLSAPATASASTTPSLPPGGTTTHPVLFPSGYLASLAAGGPAWDSQKQWCVSHLNTLFEANYAGQDWSDAAVAYSTCYQVSKLRGETADAQNFAKKALAMAIVLARHHNFGQLASTGIQQPIGLTDGSRTSFPLPFAPMDVTQVQVFRVPTREIAVTRNATGSDDLTLFAPVMKISNTSGGANAYAPSNYEVRYRDDMDPFRLAWIGTTKPATGATYFVTVANPDVSATSVTSGFTVNPTALTLTFSTPPAANQVVLVSYLGSQYQQTGNSLGGRNGVQPDGPGYPMRTFNTGLAAAYDALLDFGLLTPALKTELYTVLNSQVSWCKDFCFEHDGTGGNVSNYFIRGIVAGTFATAYATDQDNPQAATLKTQAVTLLGQMYEGVAKLFPGGYGLEGTYSDFVDLDILRLLTLYHDITGVDLIARLDFTQNVIPATIHATKPNFTFYDGGDWNELPARPLNVAIQSFLQYQPSHANAPFARKLAQELGLTPASSGTVTDYRGSFPLAYFGQVAPFYARSDWGGTAVWMSLAAADAGEPPHQHSDAGHFTIQRGGDYLLKNAGGYNFMATIYHNTLLIDDTNIAGYQPALVYPPGQGVWGRDSQLTKHANTTAYAYSEADFGNAYVNNDGVRNSVTRAMRSVVFLRPDTFVLFDQVQVAHPAIRKIFNLNFDGTLSNQSGIWSTTLGQSKLFMKPLLISATPSVGPIAGPEIGRNPDGTPIFLMSTNFQETISGNLKDVFLHVFQATASTASSMTAAAKQMRSVDRNVQGAEVVAGGKTWAVLFAAYDRAFGGNVQYLVPTAGAHGHLINDLVPSSAYVVSVTNAQGSVQRTINATTDANGTLAFDSNSGETYFYLTPGSTPPSSIPPVTTDPNA